ncbi:MAG: hypothetical protein ABIJ50_02715 [Pseudomonadota bacterium]
MLRIIITLLFIFFQTGNCLASDENCYPEAPFLDTLAFECTTVSPLTLSQGDLVVTPEATITLSVSGGKTPYQWAADTGLQPITSQGTATMTFSAKPDFCGVAKVTVTDGCAGMSSRVVRSTKGYWKEIPSNQCSSPVTGVEEITNGWPRLLIKDGYKVTFVNEFSSSFSGTISGCEIVGSCGDAVSPKTTCPPGNVFAFPREGNLFGWKEEHHEWHNCDSGLMTQEEDTVLMNGGTCRRYHNNLYYCEPNCKASSTQYLVGSQVIWYVEKWSCP